MTELYNKRMESMTDDIHNRLSDALDTVLYGFINNYEPITYDAEWSKVEHKPYDGFFPYTDGGFHTLVIYRADHDSAYCPSLFNDYMESLTKYCERDFYCEQVGEYPDDDSEVDEYMKKLFDTDTALDEDKELYYEYEMEYFMDASPGLELKVLYYSKDNPRNDKDYDAICVSIQTNTDAPYYRDGRGLSVFEKWFKVDNHAPSIVSLELQNALNEI